MISPTVGRIVWYHPAAEDGPHVRCDDDQPLAAIVVGVHDDHCINLTVFNRDGCTVPKTNVRLVQDEDEDKPGVTEEFACWMPYQKGQAAKTEQVQAALDAKEADQCQREVKPSGGFSTLDSGISG